MLGYEFFCAGVVHTVRSTEEADITVTLAKKNGDANLCFNSILEHSRFSGTFRLHVADESSELLGASGPLDTGIGIKQSPQRCW